MHAVSIIVTSYNYADYIGETISSIMEQTWTDWELVVVDDGSTDGSLDIIESFVRADTRIRLVRHPHGGNRGLAASLRLGLSEVTAPLVAFLESDDAWKSDCLERRLEAFERYDADVVFNNADIVAMGQCDSTHLARYLRNLDLRFPTSGVIPIRRHLWLSNVVPSFSCVMVRRSVLQQCDFSTPVAPWLDWWLWFQLAPRAVFVYLDDHLTRWRAHAISYSASVGQAGILKKRMVRKFCAFPEKAAPLWAHVVLRLPPPCLGLLNTMVLSYFRARRALACRVARSVASSPGLPEESPRT